MTFTSSFRKSILLLVFAAFACISASAQHTVSLNSSNTKVDWRVKPEADVTDIASIQKTGFAVNGWVKATVPGTVFADYVTAGIEKDPNYGDNIYKVDKAKYNRNFWYRTEFNVPADFTKQKIWLNFQGINRKADIYLNGTKLGSLDGFMQRGNYDITSIVNKNGPNALAVLVYCPV